MFGNKSLPTRIYSFRCHPPTEGAEIVDMQMELARRYRNSRVRVDRQRRERVEDALLLLSPALDELETQIASTSAALIEARNSIKVASSMSRKKIFPNGAAKAAATYNAELNRLYAVKRAIRKEVFASPAWEPFGEKFDERANELNRRLYWAIGRMGLSWSTRNFIATTVKRSGAPPQFSRRDGSGHLYVQLQPKGGSGQGDERVTGESLSPRDAFSEKGTFLQIGPVPSEAWEKEDLEIRRYEIIRLVKDETGHHRVMLVEGEAVLGLEEAKARAKALGAKYGIRRTKGKHLQHTMVKLRVGSKGRAPVWAVVPTMLHRPMPWDSKIKGVHLIRWKIATHCEWHVQFVLARAIGWKKPDCAADGTVSIDVGWRVTGDDGKTPRPDGSMRVAYWKVSDGVEGELVLPAIWLAGMRKVENIQSTRDETFNVARDTLAAWIEGLVEKPEWLTQVRQIKTLRQWRSIARLAALVSRWRENRCVPDVEPLPMTNPLSLLLRGQDEDGHLGLTGGEGVYALMETWRKRNKHLLEYEENLRDQLQRQRMDIYRNFAAQMRRKYRTAKIEKLDLRDFHKNQEVEEPVPDGALKEHVRDACISTLFQCLKESMAQIVEVSAQNTTAKCHVCESLQTWNHKILRHTCTTCGAEWDQDDNAAINISREDIASVPVV